MLPRLLSEIACSLNPGVDRYAMSCEWIIRESDGKILEEWFGRSVMRSRAKLSYGDAQRMLDAFDASMTDEAIVNVEKEKVSGEGKIEQSSKDNVLLEVVKSVRLLRSVAKTLRENRVENGSVRLDQAKIGFEIDQLISDEADAVGAIFLHRTTPGGRKLAPLRVSVRQVHALHVTDSKVSGYSRSPFTPCEFSRGRTREE